MIRAHQPRAPPASNGGPELQAAASKASPESPRRAFLRESSQALPRLQLALTTPADREIWVLFFPALIALVLEPVQQLADTVIIGRLGVEQLGAAGLGTVLFQFSLGFLSRCGALLLGDARGGSGGGSSRAT